MNRVEIARPVVGICHMIVCCTKGATNKEILEVCNSHNPSGTSNGWVEVIRSKKDKNMAPVQCDDHKNRIHYLVVC